MSCFYTLIHILLACTHFNMLTFKQVKANKQSVQWNVIMYFCIYADILALMYTKSLNEYPPKSM